MALRFAFVSFVARAWPPSAPRALSNCDRIELINRSRSDIGRGVYHTSMLSG